MITDAELGLKIADNKEEAFWINLKEKCEKDIETHKREIIINEAIINLAEDKIKENREEKENGE